MLALPNNRNLQKAKFQHDATLQRLSSADPSDASAPRGAFVASEEEERRVNYDGVCLPEDARCQGEGYDYQCCNNDCSYNIFKRYYRC